VEIARFRSPPVPLLSHAMWQHLRMRTTLDVAVYAAKELAKREHKTTGQILSELARKGLGWIEPSAEGEEEFLGFRPLPPRGRIVTSNLIESLRDLE